MGKTSVAKSVRSIFDDAEKSVTMPQKKKEEPEQWQIYIHRKEKN